MLHRRQGLPDAWRQIVEQDVAVWQTLDAEERELMTSIADWLLRHKHWEASQGFALDDRIRVTVAIGAALLVLRLGHDEYREVSAIIVYPSAMKSVGTRAGPALGTATDDMIPILGEAHDRRGPVILAWDEAQASARHPGRGHNVVYHEFAHKIDMLDSIMDGTPPLRRGAELARWVEVCTDVYQSLRSGADRPPIDPYGATNPAEFFAVATEAFFDVSRELQAREPALYEVMRDFYQQDPAGRPSGPKDDP